MASAKRYSFLDELRGLAVVCMVVFHALFLAGELFGAEIPMKLYGFLEPAVPFFAGFFVLEAGVCSVLSRSNFKRGLKLVLAAAVISAGTFAVAEVGGLPGVGVRFGIVHMLAVGTLLIAALYRPFSHVPGILGFILWTVLFIITYHLPDGYLRLFSLRVDLPAAWYSTSFLYPLGLPGPLFSSGDYYPLFPWVFLMFAGLSLGFFWKKHGFPKLFSRRPLPFLDAPGRYSLAVYLLHQPVLYSVFWLIGKLAG